MSAAKYIIHTKQDGFGLDWGKLTPAQKSCIEKTTKQLGAKIYFNQSGHAFCGSFTDWAGLNVLLELSEV